VAAIQEAIIVPGFIHFLPVPQAKSEQQVAVQAGGVTTGVDVGTTGVGVAGSGMVTLVVSIRAPVSRL
jgi:hypothetical protein